MEQEPGAVEPSVGPGSESDEGTSPPVSADTKGPDAPQVNPYAGTKHKVRINNQDTEVPYEDLISGFGITKAAQEKFEAAAQMRKEMDGFIDTLKSGDLRVLEKIGVPKEKRLAHYAKEMDEYLAYENLPEADKGRIAAEQERDNYKQQFEQTQEIAKKERQAKLDRNAELAVDSEIGEAMREVVAAEGLDPARPVEPWLFNRTLDLLLSDLEASDGGNPRMTAKTAAKSVFKKMRNDTRSYLSSVPTKVAIELLPPELREAIRKADVGDAVSSMQTRIRDKRTGDGERSSKKETSISTNEFFKQLDKRWS